MSMSMSMSMSMYMYMYMLQKHLHTHACILTHMKRLPSGWAALRICVGVLFVQVRAAAGQQRLAIREYKEVGTSLGVTPRP